MAAIATLNVRIAAIYKDFDSGLKSAERSMTRFSARMGQLGSDMTTSLTLPLIAFGAKSIAAAGDTEALRLAMESTFKGSGRSIQEATIELEALRQAALDPGLDMKQAVQGSIRLQSAKQSAEKAREEIIQLANAISTTGGTAPQLDAVTKQFSQMLAKGRILQEDLGIIQENMPLISGAMEKAFGTTSATKLQDMGISAQQFIDGITKQLALLPRVEGGLKNSLTNAGDAITQFFSKVGDDIAKTLDLKKGAEDLANTLGDLANYWRSLDGETKKTIISYGLYLAAAGPVLKVGSTLISGGAAVINTFRGLSSGLVSAGGSVLGFVEKFKKMDTAMKATVIGAVVVGAIALYSAFQVLQDKLDNINPAYKNLVEIQKQASDAATEEKTRISPLINILRDNTQKLDDKKRALNELQALAPKYFGDLRLEKGEIIGLDKAYKGYIDSIIRSAKAKGATDKIVELSKQKDIANALKDKILKGELDNRLQTNVALETTIGLYGALTGNLNNLATAGGNLINSEQRLKDERLAATVAIDGQVTSLDSQIASLEEVVKVNFDLAGSIAGSTNNQNAHNVATEESTKKINVYKEALDDVKKAIDKGNLLGANDIISQAEAINKGLDKVLDAGYAPDSPQVTKFVDMLKAIRAELAKPLNAGVTTNLQQLPSLDIPVSITPDTSRVEEILKALESIKVGAVDTSITIKGLSAEFAGSLSNMGFTLSQIQALGEGFAAMAAASGTAFEGLAGSILGVEGAYTRLGPAALSAALQVVKAALATTLAKSIEESMTRSGHPLAGLIVSGIVVGGVTALFSRLQQSVSKSPKFAKGAMVYGPTQAIVGDNPNAHVDPEVIAPLSKLQSYMSPSGVNISGSVTIRGSDLRYVLKKEETKRNRIR